MFCLSGHSNLIGCLNQQIVRTAYADPMYVKLAQEAIEEWKQPMFKDVFNLVGWVIGTQTPQSTAAEAAAPPTEISISAAGTYDRLIQNVCQYGRPEGIISLPDSSALCARYPDFFSHAPNFRGVYDANAGWVDSLKALETVGEACVAKGVKFVSGPQGTATSFIRTEEGSSEGEIIGVKTEDGTIFKADKIICCLGAYTDSLIDMEGQLTAVAYSTTHIQLSPDEQEKYKDMPVISQSSLSFAQKRIQRWWMTCLNVVMEALGYTFPPDANGRIKFCDLHIGGWIIETVHILFWFWFESHSYGCDDGLGHPWMQTVAGRSKPISLPRDAAYYETDTLPDEDLAEVRDFIKYCMPQFAERDFVQTKMCWDTE